MGDHQWNPNWRQETNNPFSNDDYSQFYNSNSYRSFSNWNAPPQTVGFYDPYNYQQPSWGSQQNFTPQPQYQNNTRNGLDSYLRGQFREPSPPPPPPPPCYYNPTDPRQQPQHPQDYYSPSFQRNYTADSTSQDPSYSSSSLPPPLPPEVQNLKQDRHVPPLPPPPLSEEMEIVDLTMDSSKVSPDSGSVEIRSIVSNKRKRSISPVSDTSSLMSLAASNTSFTQPPALPPNSSSIPAPVTIPRFMQKKALPAPPTIRVPQQRPRSPVSFRLQNPRPQISKGTSYNPLKNKPATETTQTTNKSPYQGNKNANNNQRPEENRCIKKFKHELHKMDIEFQVSKLVDELVFTITKFGNSSRFSKHVLVILIEYAMGGRLENWKPIPIDWSKRVGLLRLIYEIFRPSRNDVCVALRKELLADNIVIYIFGKLLNRLREKNVTARLGEIVQIYRLWEKHLPSDVMRLLRCHLEKQRQQYNGGSNTESQFQKACNINYLLSKLTNGSNGTSQRSPDGAFMRDPRLEVASMRDPRLNIIKRGGGNKI